MSRGLAPLLILDVQDGYAAERGLRGARPAPLGRLRFWLVALTGAASGQAQPLAKPLEMVVERSPSGLLLFFGKLLARRGGVAHAVEAASAPWLVRVVGECYETLEQRVEALKPGMPSGAPAECVTKLVLAPGAAYPFAPALPGETSGRLRGALRSSDGSPVAGVLVDAVDASGKVLAGPARTADDGQWVLVLRDLSAAAKARVRFVYPDGTTRMVAAPAALPDRENSVQQPALRGQVKRGKLAVTGALISVKGVAAQPAVTDDSGAWSYFLQPDYTATACTVTATLPDRSATLSAPGTLLPGGTAVVPTFNF